MLQGLGWNIMLWGSTSFHPVKFVHFQLGGSAAVCRALVASCPHPRGLSDFSREAVALLDGITKRLCELEVPG